RPATAPSHKRRRSRASGDGDRLAALAAITAVAAVTGPPHPARQKVLPAASRLDEPSKRSFNAAPLASACALSAFCLRFRLRPSRLRAASPAARPPRTT